MPYVPPHLRPGFVAPEIKKINYSGKVHWPSNLDTHRANNIIQPAKLHSPRRLSIKASAKPVAKYTRKHHKPSKKTRRH
jgi:hypothetical protein